MKIKIKGKYSKNDRNKIANVVKDLYKRKDIAKIEIYPDCLNDNMFYINYLFKNGGVHHYPVERTSEHMVWNFKTTTSAEIDKAKK